MREAVPVKFWKAWISTLKSPLNPAASVSLTLQGLEFAFCSAALLSPLHASTNDMRIQVLRTMRTTGHLPIGMNPYHRVPFTAVQALYRIDPHSASILALRCGSP